MINRTKAKTFLSPCKFELEMDVTSCQLSVKAGKTWPIGDGINAIT